MKVMFWVYAAVIAVGLVMAFAVGLAGR